MTSMTTNQMIGNPMDYVKYMTSLPVNEVFQSLKSNRERIAFILDVVRPLKQFRQEVFERADNYVALHCKSVTRSVDFRQQGLKYHNNSDYKNACVSFTKALLSAPFPTKAHSLSHLFLSFAYKSGSEFQLKDYVKALSSCNFSLELFETIEMLVHRVHCLRLLQRYTESLQCVDQLINRYSDDSLNFKNNSVEGLIAIKRYIVRQMSDSCSPWARTPQMTVSSTKSPSKDLEDYQVWVHPAFQLKTTERKGRYGVAKQFIPKGTVIFMDRPTSAVIYAGSRKTRCLNCLKHIENSIWPCVGCDEVVFCDKQCFQTSYDAHHRYECGISEMLLQYGHGFTHTYQMISRVGIQKAFEFEEQKYFDFKAYFESKRQQIGKTSERVPKDDIDFRAFHSLLTHDLSHDNFMNIFQPFRAIETAFLFDYSQQLDFDIEEKVDKFVAFCDIILQNARRVFINVFGWYANNPITPFERVHVGSCICVVSSIVNHSCQPNISWKFDDVPQLNFVANKNIEEGEEICVTYGPTARTMAFLDRHKKLKTNYHFDCNCKACLEECKDYPSISCGNCAGPVIYVDLGPYVKRDSHCLECGQKFENLEQMADKINGLITKFDEMMTYLDNDFSVDSSLNLAQNVLQTLFGLVYQKSKPLKECAKKLIRAYARHKHFLGAVQCIEQFGTIIDLKGDTFEDVKCISADILDDLILVTNCYYKFLNEGQVSDTNHWNNCFQFYTKLIGFLKMQKKVSKQNTTADNQMDVNTESLRYTIKDKKRELMELKSYYQSLVDI